MKKLWYNYGTVIHKLLNGFRMFMELCNNCGNDIGKLWYDTGKVMREYCDYYERIIARV